MNSGSINSAAAEKGFWGEYFISREHKIKIGEMDYSDKHIISLPLGTIWNEERGIEAKRGRYLNKAELQKIVI